MRILSNGVIEPSTFNTQQFNNNVDIKNFIMDRFYNGAVEDVEISDMYPIDLSTCKAKIRVNNPDDIVELGNNLTITNLEGETVAEDDDLISLNWIITNNITRYAGKRQYQIEFYNDNNTLVFRTRVMNFVVNESLDSEAAIIETAPSLIEEWENKLNTVLNQSNDFNTYADTKITEKIENKMYFYKESMQEITTSIENENNFPITMQNYNKDNCITQINVNGIRNTAYTINELNEVVFNTPIKVIGTKIQIFILKAIISDSIDLNTLKGEKGDPGKDGKDSVEIIDNLTSTDTDKALSANMGKELNDKIDNEISVIETTVNSLASGSPLVASSVSDMTDTTRVYVNTTDGNWYYYNGTSWVVGGVYQAIELDKNSVNYDNLKDVLRYGKREILEITDFTLVRGKFIYTNGNIIDANYKIGYGEVEVSSGENYKIYSYIGKDYTSETLLYAIYDKDNNLIVKEIVDKNNSYKRIITIPKDGAILRVNFSIVDGSINIENTTSLRGYINKIIGYTPDTVSFNALDKSIRDSYKPAIKSLNLLEKLVDNRFLYENQLLSNTTNRYSIYTAEVKPNTTYYVNGSSFWNNPALFFANNIIINSIDIDGKNVDFYGIVDHDTEHKISGSPSNVCFYFTTPDYCTRVYINVYENNVTPFLYECDYRLNNDEIYKEIRTKGYLTKGNMIDSEVGIYNDGFLNKNGKISKDGNNYYYSDFIDLSNFPIFEISANAKYLTCCYCLYDKNYNFIVAGGYDSKNDSNVFDYTNHIINFMDLLKEYPNAGYIRFGSFDKPLVIKNIIPYTNDEAFDILNGTNDNCLSGKKWVACGDSFTEGDFTGYVDKDGNTGKNSDAYDKDWGMYKTYPWWIGKRNNMNIINEAKCGTILSLSKQYVAGTQPITYKNPFSYERYKNIPSDADYITIAFGLNDMYNTNLGTIDDTTNETFYGALNVVLEYLLTNYPRTKIATIVMNSYLSRPYADAIKEASIKWGVACLDMMYDSNVAVYMENSFMCERAKEIRRNHYHVTSSNGHPNLLAHEMESTVIEDFLRRL